MSIFDKAKLLLQNNDFKSVRIEKIKPFQVDYEIDTDTVWFENHNIERCIEATHKLGLRHIHLQTNGIDFLKDVRLKNVKGITIQFEIDNIELLYHYKKLTHLGLPQNIKIEFDFSNFKDMVYLGGTLPRKYVNLDHLINLKYTYLFDYRKKDFSDFAGCLSLQRLWIYSLNIENLNGLSNLINLAELDLERCPKLTSLEGIGRENKNLKKVHLENCKNLKKAESLKTLIGLTQLRLYNILELNSLEFLNDLPNLEILMVHPSKVGVKYQDYYPLVNKLKSMNQLDNLKGWKPLKSYLENTFLVQISPKDDKTELELIKSNLGLMTWVEKLEDGLEQYSKKNCKKAESIIIEMINRLEQSAPNDLKVKEDLIKDGVLALNRFNKSLSGSFIETQEREQICDIFDNIAGAVGLDVQNYPDGIASMWREW